VTIPVNSPENHTASETKYAVLSYKKSYYDSGGDVEHSELEFEDQLTFVLLEGRINQLRGDQPDVADYDGDGAWQFLVFADGVPVGGRGPDFETKRRWPKGEAPKLWEAIAVAVEGIFERADITSHEKRMARYAEAERLRQIEQKKAKEQRDAWEYSRALDTLEDALKNKKLNPEIAYKEKKVLEKLTAALTPTVEKKEGA
jgi:hypothetical protein